jgi:hypothetical protein
MISFKAIVLLATVSVAASCGSEPVAPTRTPPLARHTLSATLWGNSQVRPGESCLWEIMPSGGVPPYTYTYPDLNSGTDPTFYVTFANTGNYIFRVYINDSQGTLTHVDQPVSVRNTNPSC